RIVARATALPYQPAMWLSIASVKRRSLPMRDTSTGIGTFPLRKPGILTLSARSDAACSTAWWTSALGTSTVSRTLLSGNSSTWALTDPLHQRSSTVRPVPLYVIARHGESTLNFENRVNGDPKVPVHLTAKGREEARLLGQQIAHTPFDLCVYTPFLRTRETAEIALAGRDVPLEEHPELGDIDIGELEGRTLEDYHAWKHQHTRRDPFPGGESLDDAALRYADAIERLLRRPESTVLIVTHEIPLRYAINAADGSNDLDRPTHRLANATPYLFDEQALSRAVEQIRLLASTGERTRTSKEQGSTGT